MHWVLLVTVILGLIFGPTIWVKFTLARYRKPRPDIPGTGAQFARHLLHRFELSDVNVEPTQKGQDCYDTVQKCVRLSPDVFHGRSLTAIAVAAHEVGHAIQYGRHDKVTLLRRRYLPKAHRLQQLGTLVLVGWPLISLALQIPYAVALHASVVLLTGLASVFMHIAVLPEEWDASFKKALPLLVDGEYLANDDLPKVKRILTACAITYVAAALVRILYVWHWFKR